jgi:HEAT repeat protein
MKHELRALLEESRFEEIGKKAQARKRVMSALISLMYDREALVAWRAVEALGVAADRIAGDDRDFVVTHLRRLHWLLSDESGGICLHAPAAMAEIVRRRPAMFAEYVPLIMSLLLTMEEEDLAHFRPNILWGIGRLAPAAREESEAVAPAVLACLDHANSQVRGMAVWCLRQMGMLECCAARKDLFADDGCVEIYEEGILRRTCVSALLDS